MMQLDVGVDPEAALSSATDAVTNKDLPLAVRELVECAKRAKHCTLDALVEQLNRLSPLRIV